MALVTMAQKVVFGKVGREELGWVVIFVVVVCLVVVLCYWKKGVGEDGDWDKAGAGGLRRVKR